MFRSFIFITWLIPLPRLGMPSKDWYRFRQDEMKADEAMRFFLELRNISQKQGPISSIGGSTATGYWSYRFVSQQAMVPTELIGRDIAECCAAHLRKLAQLVLACFHTLPIHSCPARAFTTEGMKALGYTVSRTDGRSFIRRARPHLSGSTAELTWQSGPKTYGDLDDLTNNDWASEPQVQ